MSLTEQLDKTLHRLMAAEIAPLAIRLGAIPRRTLTREIMDFREHSYLSASPEVRKARDVTSYLGEVITHFHGLPIVLDLNDDYKIAIEVQGVLPIQKWTPTPQVDERSESVSDVPSSLRLERSSAG